jgi:hypothetical protein
MKRLWSPVEIVSSGVEWKRPMMEVDMKKVLIFVALLFTLVAFAFAAPEMKGISAQDVSGKPDVFCKVTKEPDPLLLGGWKCIHHKYDQKLHKYVDEQVEYWLVKSGDRYGFYFYRVKPGEKTYKGWRECTINGNTISSRAGYKVFTQNGEVFYTWGTGGDKPTKMTRIEG